MRQNLPNLLFTWSLRDPLKMVGHDPFMDFRRLLLKSAERISQKYSERLQGIGTWVCTYLFAKSGLKGKPKGQHPFWGSNSYKKMPIQRVSRMLFGYVWCPCLSTDRLKKSTPIAMSSHVLKQKGCRYWVSPNPGRDCDSWSSLVKATTSGS